MRSRIVTKVAIAVTVALVAEISDIVLDKVGMSENGSQLTRAMLKSSVATLSGVLLGKVFLEPDDNGLRDSGQIQAEREHT
jgi:hypothetical protein